LPPASSTQIPDKSLTHGFFGELGDEILTKDARDYTVETLKYLYQTSVTEI